VSDTRKLARDIKTLVGQPQTRKTLEAKDAATALGAATGAGKPKLGGSAGSGGASGIASPLTEPSYEARTWHEFKTVTSPDGIWAFRVQAVESITMMDAYDMEVVFIYAAEA